MAQNVTVAGASYSDVPSVLLPKTGGGTASFYDVTDTTAEASDVVEGKYFYTAAGVLTEGTATLGGGVIVSETPDTHGGTVVEITAEVLKLQAKTVSPSESQQIVGPDTAQGYNGLSAVTVNAISSSYVGSGVARKTSSDLGVNGATVTAPAGYYASSASTSVASGTVTAPSTISGTAASVSTGTNTLTLTKTVSVTPSVTTAGYVSAGTAGNASVSLQANVTTQAAQTIHPSTSDQTIAASRYLTGTQTIKAVTMSNLTADNIKSGVVVDIGDSTDADCVASVTGTYSGGGSSMNVQIDNTNHRISGTTYTDTGATITVSVAGTYDIYWSAFRSSTSSGTNGTQLYKNENTQGSAFTTWSNSYAQTPKLTGVTLAKDDVLTVYARASSNSRYVCVGNLTIIQTA